MPDQLFSAILFITIAYVCGSIPFGYLIARLKRDENKQIAEDIKVKKLVSFLYCWKLGEQIIFLHRRWKIIQHLLNSSLVNNCLLFLCQLLARLKIGGIDIRQWGSKNIGFTNVWRVAGPGYAIPVLFLDIAKGALPLWLIAPLLTTPDSLSWFRILGGAAAISGHVFTFLLSFKGGKGVATALGVLLALNLTSALIALGIFIFIFLISQYVSLASIGAGMSLGVYSIVAWGFAPFTLLMIVIALVIIYKHRKNIKRLFRGEEPRAFTIRLLPWHKKLKK